MSKANVRSTEALEELARHLGRFSDSAREVLSDTETRIRAEGTWLEDQCAERTQVVEDCERRVAILEEENEDFYVEEELQSAIEDLEEARDRLRTAKSHARRFHEELGRFRAESFRFSFVWSETAQRARHFLHSRVIDVETYTAIGTVDPFPEAAQKSTPKPETMSTRDEALRMLAMEAARTLDEMPELQPSVWKRLSLRERLEVVVRIENVMARQQGRAPRSIHLATLRERVCGGFDPEVNRIWLSSDYLAGDDHDAMDIAVDTILHEGRHAYQWDAIHDPQLHHDKAEVEEWRRNFEPDQYKTPGRYSVGEYLAQPLERDAFEFEEEVRGARRPPREG